MIENEFYNDKKKPVDVDDKELEDDPESEFYIYIKPNRNSGGFCEINKKISETYDMRKGSNLKAIQNMSRKVSSPKVIMCCEIIKRKWWYIVQAELKFVVKCGQNLLNTVEYAGPIFMKKTSDRG